MKIKDKNIAALGRNFALVLDEKLTSDGLCCPVDETITINPSCKNIPRIVLHEACHAILFSGGIFEALDNERICDIICEQVARTIDENFEIRWRKKK